MNVFATAALARKFEKYAARGLIDEARTRKADLQRAVDDTVRALGKLHYAGVDRDFISDTARGLHDAVENADKSCNTTIDNAAEHHDDIDLRELDEFITLVRADTP